MMKLRNTADFALAFDVDGQKHTAPPGGLVVPEIEYKKAPSVLKVHGLPLAIYVEGQPLEPDPVRPAVPSTPPAATAPVAPSATAPPATEPEFKAVESTRGNQGRR